MAENKPTTVRDLLEQADRDLDREVFFKISDNPFLKDVQLETQTCRRDGKVTKRLIIHALSEREW